MFLSLQSVLGITTNTIEVCSTLGSSTSTLKVLHHLTHANLFSPPRLFAYPRRLQPYVIACSDKFKVEPITNVKFPTSLVAPGGSSTLSLIGTGYREKSIAFIKVKVYAIGVYLDAGITTSLAMWKDRSEDELCKDASFFNVITAATMEKAIKIVLIRDVDGATFWAALDEAVAPRLKATNSGAGGQEALDAFGEVFRGRSLKEGTSIYLTWVQPFKLQVAVSGDFMVPKSVEASIVSADLVSSLFDVYLGEDPVSPSTKASIASGLKASLQV